MIHKTQLFRMVFRIILVIAITASTLWFPRSLAQTAAFVFEEQFTSYAYKAVARDAEWDIGSGVLSLMPQDTMIQGRPVIAALPGQGAYVAWEDGRENGTSIFIQHLDVNGNRLWANDVKVSDPLYRGSQENPELVVDGEGGVIVVWNEWRGGDLKVLAQRITPGGMRAWAQDLLVADATSTSQEEPAIAADGTGNFFISWSDLRANVVNIYLQKIAINGQRLWLQDTQVSDLHFGKYQFNSAIAFDGQGGAWIVWEDAYPGNLDPDIGEILKQTYLYLQNVRSDGTRVLAGDINLPTAITTDDPSTPAVAWHHTLDACSDLAGGLWIFWNNYYTRDLDGLRITAGPAAAITKAALPVQINLSPDAPVSDLLRVNPYDATYTAPDPVRIATDGAGGVYVTIAVEDDIGVVRIGANGQDMWQNTVIPYNEALEATQEMPAVAADGLSGIWVAWQDQRRQRGDVYMQRISDQGNTTWQNEIRCNWDSGAASRQSPAISLDLAGNSWLTWSDTRRGLFKTYVQKLDPAGNIQFADTRAVTNWVTNREIAENKPDIEVNMNGDTLVAWWDSRDQQHTYTQVFDINGNQRNPVETKANRFYSQSSYPAVEEDGSGGYFVAWEDNRSGMLDIYAQRLDAFGRPLWDTDARVTELSRVYRNPEPMCADPEIIPDGQGGAYVAWWDNRDAYRDVYVQHIDASGQRLWNHDIRASLVPDASTRNLFMFAFWRPGLVSDGMGGVIVVWYDNRSGFNDLYSQHINANGQRLWATDLRISQSTSPTARDAMRVDGFDGMFWVTWRESRDNPADSDIYLQRLDANGTALWPQDIKVGQALGQAQYQPVVGVDAGGNAVIAWDDRRNASGDLYAQRFSPSGTPLWTQDVAAVRTGKFYAEAGEVISKKINSNTQFILRATVHPKYSVYGGTLNFYLSNNGGENWMPATPGQVVIFPSTGNDLRWRVELFADPATVQSPIIDSLSVEYDTTLPAQGDAYEEDDLCTSARPLVVNSSAQFHNFHKSGDADWVMMQVSEGVEYIIQTSDVEQNADTTPAFYRNCSSALSVDYNAFGSEFQVRYRASYTGDLYVRVTNQDPQMFGADTGYRLSVRSHVQTPVVVIIAGHDDSNTLQANIDYSADLAYTTMVAAGIPRNRIRYLSPHSFRDLNNDGQNDIAALANLANARWAIEDWPKTQGIGPGTPFFLYMVDHGHHDAFLVNGSAQQIRAVDLDLWLSNLEATTQVDQINVIIEACKSGSFIDVTTSGPDKISKSNRVVIGSTSSGENAYASPRGAYFSDAFWTALGQNMDLFAAYNAGHQTVRANGLGQFPWLDDNGDAVSDSRDGLIARQRGLNASFNDHAPVIDAASIEFGKSSVVITVHARDDFDTPSLLAVMYPPSFQEPSPTDGSTTPILDVTTYSLTRVGTTTYTLNLQSSVLQELGQYRFVVFAEDGEMKQSKPYILELITGEIIFLPFITR